jgi:hypothetical protein
MITLKVGDRCDMEDHAWMNFGIRRALRYARQDDKKPSALGRVSSASRRSMACGYPRRR